MSEFGAGHLHQSQRAAGFDGNHHRSLHGELDGARERLLPTRTPAATTTRDTNPADNSATVNIAVASGTQADLSVTNSGSPNPVTAGNNITYTQSVTNNGPATANAPVFTETLPANTTVVSLTGPAGWTCVWPALLVPTRRQWRPAPRRTLRSW